MDPAPAEKGEETMAGVKKEKAAADRVTLKLFYDGRKYADDVTVIINGKSYLIQRGVEVEVPRAVKLLLEDAARQEQQARQYIDDMRG